MVVMVEGGQWVCSSVQRVASMPISIHLFYFVFLYAFRTHHLTYVSCRQGVVASLGSTLLLSPRPPSPPPTRSHPPAPPLLPDPSHPSTAGKAFWVQQYGSGAFANLQSVTVDEFGRVFTAGGFRGEMNVLLADGSSSTLSTGTSSHAFVMEFDPSSLEYPTWAVDFGGAGSARGESIAAWAGAWYMAGGFSGDITIPLVDGINTTFSSVGEGDLVVIKGLGSPLPSPSPAPTTRPTRVGETYQPTTLPSVSPSQSPSLQPTTTSPSSQPSTLGPSAFPTILPSAQPSTPAPTESQVFTGQWVTLSVPRAGYVGAASSGNGSIYAVSTAFSYLNGKDFAYSSDAGASFAPIPGAPSPLAWPPGMTMTPDAETIFAVGISKIYKRSVGVWTELVNGNVTLSLEWRGVGVTADGMQVVAGALQAGLWRSIDGGISWYKLTNSSMDARGWTGVALSAGGRQIFCSAENTGRGLFRSIDFGT